MVYLCGVKSNKKIIMEIKKEFEWGQIVQLSRKGQRARVYIPKPFAVQTTKTVNEDRDMIDITYVVNVNLKVGGKRVWGVNNWHDLLGGLPSPDFKITGTGDYAIAWSKKPFPFLPEGAKVRRFTSTNGGGHFVYVLIIDSESFEYYQKNLPDFREYWKKYGSSWGRI